MLGARGQGAQRQRKKPTGIEEIQYYLSKIWAIVEKLIFLITHLSSLKGKITHPHVLMWAK